MALRRDQRWEDWVLNLVEHLSSPGEGEGVLTIHQVTQRVSDYIRQSGEVVEQRSLDLAFERHLQALLQYLGDHMPYSDESEIRSILYGLQDGFRPTFCKEIIETGVRQHLANRAARSYYSSINPPSPTHSPPRSSHHNYISSSFPDSSSEYELQNNFHHIKLSSPSLEPKYTHGNSSMPEHPHLRPSMSHPSMRSGPPSSSSPAVPLTSLASLQPTKTYHRTLPIVSSSSIGPQTQYAPNELRHTYAPQSPAFAFAPSREPSKSVSYPFLSQMTQTSPIHPPQISPPPVSLHASSSSTRSPPISGPPTGNTSIRISAPDSDEKTRISAATNPVAIGPPPAAPECESFEKKQFCYKTAKCRAMHHVEQTVCQYLVRSLPCKGCSMQHPNEVTFHLLKEKVREILGVEKSVWEGEIQKRKIVFRWDGNLTKTCRDAYSKCGVVDCKRNHVKSSIPASLSSSGPAASSSSSRTAVNLVDVTTAPEYVSFVQGLLNRSQKKYSIVKLIRIDNSPLKERYDTHIEQYNKQKGSNERLARLSVFHGSSTANCESIAHQGFVSSNIRRQAYGPGHYFALKPDVSVGYCAGSNTMLICEVIEECHVWVQQHEFFVVKDDNAILPQFILYFTVT